MRGIRTKLDFEKGDSKVFGTRSASASRFVCHASRPDSMKLSAQTHMQLLPSRVAFFALPCALFFPGFAAADIFSISTPESQSRGWYDVNDFHTPGNDSYFAGNF